jgi:hypothetical protein
MTLYSWVAVESLARGLIAETKAGMCGSYLVPRRPAGAAGGESSSAGDGGEGG